MEFLAPFGHAIFDFGGVIDTLGTCLSHKMTFGHCKTIGMGCGQDTKLCSLQ